MYFTNNNNARNNLTDNLTGFEIKSINLIEDTKKQKWNIEFK